MLFYFTSNSTFIDKGADINKRFVSIICFSAIGCGKAELIVRTLDPTENLCYIGISK